MEIEKNNLSFYGSPPDSSGGALYIHIPFCKQACHYCDFHFSTSLRKKPELVRALCKEMVLRKEELTGEIESVYFGGGTPSLLSAEELQQIFQTVFSNFRISDNAEITLEANPDDLTNEKLEIFSSSPINRLSIGIQSFFDRDLKLMNRSHNYNEALQSIKLAKNYFKNISIDLIYGIPGLTDADWMRNLKTAIDLGVPHISSYALTVETGTALKKMIDTGKIKPVDESLSRKHYQILTREMNKAGFDNYEFSNFGKPGFYSRNNTAYWFGKSYIGIGPSAHSFNGDIRSWNVNNNTLYIKALEKGKPSFESEVLSIADRYNEYIMTRLRTKWGVELQEVEKKFGKQFKIYLQQEAKKSIDQGLLVQIEDKLFISKEGKFLSDGIAAGLFWVNLD